MRTSAARLTDRSAPRFTRSISVAATVLVAAASAVGARGHDGSVACPRPAFAELKRAFADDMRSKSLEPVLSLYDPSATFFDDNLAIRDPTQLRRLFMQVFARFDSNLRLEAGVVTATRRGTQPACTEVGRYTESLTDRATGQVQHIRRGYRFVYAPDRGGRWRFATMDWRPR